MTRTKRRAEKRIRTRRNQLESPKTAMLEATKQPFPFFETSLTSEIGELASCVGFFAEDEQQELGGYVAPAKHRKVLALTIIELQKLLSSMGVLLEDKYKTIEELKTLSHKELIQQMAALTPGVSTEQFQPLQEEHSADVYKAILSSAIEHITKMRYELHLLITAGRKLSSSEKHKQDLEKRTKMSELKKEVKNLKAGDGLSGKRWRKRRITQIEKMLTRLRKEPTETTMHRIFAKKYGPADAWRKERSTHKTAPAPRASVFKSQQDLMRNTEASNLVQTSTGAKKRTRTRGQTKKNHSNTMQAHSSRPDPPHLEQKKNASSGFGMTSSSINHHDVNTHPTHNYKCHGDQEGPMNPGKSGAINPRRGRNGDDWERFFD